MRKVEPRQRCVVVLGMHRSGTSAMARVVNVLGADLGNELLPPSADNPEGYWEHLRIYHNHERILNALGRVWHSVTPMPENWQVSEAVAPYRERLLSIVRQEFEDKPFWAVKDPRMCRLLPLWHGLFQKVDCHPYFIHVIRNPLEVAWSMVKRDGFSMEKCALLWLFHVCEAVLGTEGADRVFVAFDSLLGDWRKVVVRVRETLGIEFPKTTDECSDEISSFLRPGLRHHTTNTDFSPVRDDRLREFLESVYSWVLEATGGRDPGPASSPARLHDELTRLAGDLPAPILAEEITALCSRLAETDGWVAKNEAAIASCNAELASCNATLDSILSSRSWRMTAPLRYWYDLLNGLRRGNPSRSWTSRVLPPKR